MDYIKIDESKLDLENYHFDMIDKDTAVLTLESLYEFEDKYYTLLEINSFTDSGSQVTPMVEYWLDENKWKYVLLYEYDTVNWDISNELRHILKKEIARQLCTYDKTGCSDCEFNYATNFDCPLGRD